MSHTIFRFFVSYSKTDEEIAKVVVEVLAKAKHYVREMGQLMPGVPYPEETRRWIDSSHFVIPIITEQSKNRAWVNQEIGYALGRHIPLVPIIFGRDAGALAFLTTVHQIVAADTTELVKKLRTVDWSPQLKAHRDLSPFPVSACASDANFRSQLLANAATTVARNFPSSHLRLRQSSRLTSFSLPVNRATRPWRSLGDIVPELFWLQTEERRALQSLADRGRCDLRIDPDYYEYSDGRNRLFQPAPTRAANTQRGYDPRVQLARLTTLRDFLATRTDKNVHVVVDDQFAASESITIIGNQWLAASATVAPFGRSRRTIWTWHAPTVEWECENFDGEFSSALLQQAANRDNKKKSSRLYGIERIERAIGEICREFKL